MTNCERAKQFLLKHLMRDIELHEAGLYSEIGKAQDGVTTWSECEAEDEEEAHCLAIVIDFRDRWADARNHDWGYYPGVEKDDWPVIARQIHQGVVEQWEPDKLTDNFVFQPPPRTSLWQRIKARIFKE